MARLPSDEWLIQQIGDEVILFQDYTEREIGRFDPSDAHDAAQFQKTIYNSELSAEDKSFAHFWCGYFYAHAMNVGAPVVVQTVDNLEDFLKGL